MKSWINFTLFFFLALYLNGCLGGGLNIGTGGANGGANAYVPAIGDLTYLNGSQVLGKGTNASGNANQFLECNSQLAHWLPKKASRWIVAFGGTTPGATCGVCTAQFACSAGETITIATTFSSVPEANPAAYDADGGNTSDLGHYTDTCPSTGLYQSTRFPTAGGPLNYVKITFTANDGTDSEYLQCQ